MRSLGAILLLLLLHSTHSTRMEKEWYRTGYHFQPRHNWMNDPNGPMYYNGIYHLFYQYNPTSAEWIKNISWGHSVSTNLVDWTEIEIALFPSEPFDILGCWSGSATILTNNGPVIFYTSVDKDGGQTQSVAYPQNLSNPYLSKWTKPAYNPVIEPFNGINGSLFRDPSTAWMGSDGWWRVLIGTVIDRSGRALLYKSDDFINWTRNHDPLYFMDGSGMWECIDFFPIGEGKHLLKVSFLDSTTDGYKIGKYDEERDIFVSNEDWNKIDFGEFYASKSFFDEVNGRRILWGWSNELDTGASDIAKGWAGIQGIPRVLSLDKDSRTLIQWPVREVEVLRRNELRMQNIELGEGVLVEIKGITASQADIEMEFQTERLDLAEHLNENLISDPQKLCQEKGAHLNGGGIGPFGLLVLASDNLEEHTAIFFYVFRNANGFVAVMCADMRRSSLGAEVKKPVYGGLVEMKRDRNCTLSLRTLIDHSAVEIFGNGGRTCIATRVYPTLVNSLHIYAFNNGTGVVKIHDLKAWNMAAAPRWKKKQMHI